MFDKDELSAAADLVRRRVAPTPQYAWPLLGERIGARVWVKHENHTPTGCFKARGGWTLIDWLRKTRPEVRGVVTATRGNHGQSQALAGTTAGLRVVVVVPQGNSREKNAAMRAFGAELIEIGRDFDEARREAQRLADADGLFLVPPFHREIVRGVATYGLELLTAVPDLDTVYVPIGCGSGICGTIAARDALGLRTRIVGVVSAGAPAAKLSFDAGRIISTPSVSTWADGLAVGTPVPEAFEVYREGADRIVSVTDGEIREAVRALHTDTHNLAEGAGAAPLAALMNEREAMRGKNVAVVLSGGNVDIDLHARMIVGN